MVTRIVEDYTDKWIKNYEEFGKVFLKNAADDLLEWATWWIEFYNAMDTGELLNSLEIRETKKGYKVKANAPHAVFVHDGRMAGSKNPPLEVILKWIKRKKFDTSKTKVPFSLMKWMNKQGLTTPSRSGKPTKQHRDVACAFYVMKSIAAQGIEPKPFFRNAIQELKSNVDKVVDMTKRELGISA